MSDYTKPQPHPNSKLNKAQIGEIMGGPMAPDADNDDDMKNGTGTGSGCLDCQSGNVASTSIETANVNGGKGVMVTQRHHDPKRGKDEPYKEATSHKHIFTDHNSFANHFKGHFSGSGPKQQSE